MLLNSFASIEDKHSAFTLIEVLIALTIVAIALGSAISVTSQDIMRADSMQQRTYANWIAQNKIAEYRINELSPKTGKDEGEVFFAGDTWNWETTITETGIDNLYRLDVAVSISSRDLPERTITGFIQNKSKITP